MPTNIEVKDDIIYVSVTGECSLDDANTTGFYTELIAVTSGNGFESGKTYTIYIEATVDSDTGGICFAFKVTS